MPFPYKKILCPVEFDDYCVAAINEAAALAAGGGMLFILHVVHINPLTAQGAVEGLAAEEMYEAQLNSAREKLNAMLAHLPPEVNREVMIEVGTPADVIVTMEEKLGADLIVLATHGRSGLKRLVLGSMAEDLLHRSSIPVLMVRPPATETAA